MKSLTFAVGLLVFAAQCYAFDNFDAEVQKTNKNIGCNIPKMTGSTPGSGRLYGCYGGVEQTVKYWINEEERSTAVRNVKFVWVDYTRNTGSGLHADADTAKVWASALGTIYAPTKVAAVLKVFAGKSATVIDGGDHHLSYTYRAGPAAAERMIVVTRKGK